jgi:Ca2+:H+ antiporter
LRINWHPGRIGAVTHRWPLGGPDAEAGEGKDLVKAKWLNVLFIAVPLTGAAWYLNRQGPYAGQLTLVIFGLALLAVIPLAGVFGRLTDTLGRYLGDRLGGLLSASFGNVPELAIGIALLIHAHLHMTQALTVDSDLKVIRGLLLGSVINNLLFVLGSAVFFAALRNGRMTFSAEGAGGYASMLALAVVGLALPTIAVSLAGVSGEELQVSGVNVSVPFGIILILSYIAYIAATEFHIGTRPRRGAARGEAGEAGEVEEAAMRPAITTDGAVVLADAPAPETAREQAAQAASADVDVIAREKRRELRRQSPYAVPVALAGLAAASIATVLIAVVLVSVTDNVIVNTNLTPLSVGLVLFPIVCNLGEQAGAITNAWRNRMEGTMAVAAGSSVQVALFVTPVLALVSVPLAAGNLALMLPIIFPALELVVLGLVCFVYALVSLDGETTWLEGLQLLAFYAMVVAVAFVLPGR